MLEISGTIMKRVMDVHITSFAEKVVAYWALEAMRLILEIHATGEAGI